MLVGLSSATSTRNFPSDLDISTVLLRPFEVESFDLALGPVVKKGWLNPTRRGC